MVQRLLLCVLVLSFACSTESGPLTEATSSPEPSATPSPTVTATPTPLPTPAATPSPVPAESRTFSGRDGRMYVELTVTPARPSIGEEVTFDFVMRYDGTGDERDPTFGFQKDIEGSRGDGADCNCETSDPNAPAGLRPAEERMRDKRVFNYPGPYLVFFAAGVTCDRERRARVETEITVSGEVDLPNGEVLLPHWHPNVRTAVLIKGFRVEGDGDGPCVWVRQNGKRSAALWPIGYRARFDPVRIYDEKDREVWREGVTRDGGGQANGRLERVPAKCRTGNEVFTIDPA